jgi:3-deoxy-manno-octulosonate cytidylyltransferase (CMP-KDO synthetase)
MRTAIVIPARYASTRLPAKPLLKSTGKYLIQHVYEQACRAKSARYVIVATDDSRVAAAVEGFGGNCVMTRSDHASGTDRVAEVAADLDVDVVVNLQGDEPEISPDTLDLLPELLEGAPEAPMATLAAPITSRLQWLNPNVVKVVADDEGRALYFSRAPIPCVRDGQPDFAAQPPRFLQHLGLYAYRREFLLQLSKFPPSPLEEMERLEQLRALAAGAEIRVGLVKHAGCGVDTFEQYQAFVRRYRSAHRIRAAQAA